MPTTMTGTGMVIGPQTTELDSTIITPRSDLHFQLMIHGTGGMADGITTIRSFAEHTILQSMPVVIPIGTILVSPIIRTTRTIHTLMEGGDAEQPELSVPPEVAVQ
jgi:hypothetical protein